MNSPETDAFYNRFGRTCDDEVEFAQKLEQERDEAREWCKRLQKDTQTLTCVYCGKEYPPGSPTHGADVLTEHIRVCEKHPLRKVEIERDKWREFTERLYAQCGRDLEIENALQRFEESSKEDQ